MSTLTDDPAHAAGADKPTVKPMDLYPTMHSDRPPGGTRRPGNKTPRKVQWVGQEESPERHTRALDEHGLDVRLLTFLKSILHWC
jgi:hypothetical protein